MADEIIIETTSAEVIEVGVPGPQGPQGAAGTGLETLTTQGDMLYRGASTGQRLPIGTAGQILKVSAGGIPEWGAAPASGVSSVNGETGAVTLDGSDIDTSGNDDLAAFVTYEFADGNGIYYPLPDSTLNNKRVYRTTTGHHVFFQNLRWHITDGSPNTQNIIESSDDDNAAWPWLSAWDGSIEKAQLSTVVGRARSTFLFVGDSIPNSSVSGLSSVAASGAYADLSGKPTLGTASTKDAPATGNASSTQVVLGNDTRLSDSRTPTAHAASHAAGGSDPLPYPTILSSPTGVNKFKLGLGGDSEAGRFVGVTTAGDPLIGILNYADEESYAPDNEVGSSAFGMVLGANDTNLFAQYLQDGAVEYSYTFPSAGGTLALTTSAPASHAHGNLTNDGKVGSTSGLPLVTTTAGAVTTLALGTAGQVLRTKSDLSGVEFADPSGGGVTGAAASAADVLGVSGANITGVDAGSDKIVFWDDSASELTYLTVGSGLSLTNTELTATASGGSKTYAVFTATDNNPPATDFATLDTRNSIACLDFSDTATESAVFVGIMPEAASLGSGLIVRLHWMGTATTGNVRWSVAFERGNTDLDIDSFDTATAATATTNGTSGIVTVTAITCTSIDSITAGDLFRLRVQRLGADAADTMTGAKGCELVAVEVRSAA